MAARSLGIPSFGLDLPHGIFTPQGMEYWLREHQALIRFLEERTGRSMDYDHLKEVVRLSCHATRLYVEINELRSTVPCPLPAEAALAPLAVYRAWAGTQNCVDFLEQLRDELKERAARGIGAVAPERFRYTYATSPPFADLGVTAEMEKRYGAVNVMDPLQWWRDDGDWLVDPEDPVASLAYKVQLGTYSSPHNSVLDQAEEVRLAALKCKADGVIYFNDPGCRLAAGGYRILEDTIARSPGLPWATINCDTPGMSHTASGGVMDQLDVFFETVENSEVYQSRVRQRGQQAHETRVTA
jgi:hypothetical protein